MISEENRNIAIMRAKSCLISECFISESAAEFVLACLTYMLKWPYKITLKSNEEDDDVRIFKSLYILQYWCAAFFTG